jgi:hypothetical protein
MIATTALAMFTEDELFPGITDGVEFTWVVL